MGWYRKNQILNVVATVPECIAQPKADDPNLKATMLELFADFSPEVKALTSLTDKVMVSSFRCPFRVFDSTSPLQILEIIAPSRF